MNDPTGGRMSEQEYQSVVINERLIVNIMTQIIRIDNQLLNTELRVQLIDTHTSISKGLKIDCKATRYLLK